MAVLARAHPQRLADLMPDLPPHMFLRTPEVGAVMVRGRIGNQGGACNLGETTVTRVSVQLTDGTVGHARVQGRDRQHTSRAAVADTLMQTERAADLQRGALSVLDAEMAVAQAVRASKAAATKVGFFTMMRREDT
jgi:alpha-D-ribose 1-methylphosphonate 5-triphosphate synthase subunit PhnG